MTDNAPRFPEPGTTGRAPRGTATGTPTWADRFRGAMLGGAVGDALGSGVRNHTTSDIQQWFGQRGVVDYLTPYGRRGASTDLTQLTVFTLEALLRGKASNVDPTGWLPTQIVATNHLRWLYSQGVPWEYAMSAYSRPHPVPAGWLLERPELFSTRNPTGAPLYAMGRLATSPPRTSHPNETPLAGASFPDCFVWAAPTMVWSPSEDLVYDAGASIANMMTWDSVTVAGAGFHADVLGQLMRGVSLWDAVSASDGQRLGRTYGSGPQMVADVTRTVNAARFASYGGRRPEPARLDVDFDTAGKPGVLGIALASVACNNNFADAVLMAVNQSADSSVTGALTGQLAGAIYGPQSIPRRWLDELELREIIEVLCDDAAEAFAPPPMPKWAQRYVDDTQSAFTGQLELTGPVSEPATDSASSQETYLVNSERVWTEQPQRPVEAVPEEPAVSSVETTMILPITDFGTDSTPIPAEQVDTPVEDDLLPAPEPDAASEPLELGDQGRFGSAHRLGGVAESVQDAVVVPQPHEFEPVILFPEQENFASEPEEAEPRAEAEVRLGDVRPEAARSKEVRRDDVRSEAVQSGNVRSDEVWSEDVRPETVRSDAVRLDDVRPDDARRDDARREEIRSEAARPRSDRLDDARSEGVRSEDVRSDEVWSEDVRPEAVGSYEVGPENVRPEDAWPEDVRSEAVRSEAVRSAEEVRLADVQPEEIQPEYVQPEYVQPEEIRPESDRSEAEWERPEPGSARLESPDDAIVGDDAEQDASAPAPIVAGGHAVVEDVDEIAPSRAERVLGCFLGGALGDALGSDLEFATAEQIGEKFGPTGPTGLREAYGVHGAITDDTQMTLFTAEGLIRGRIASRMLGNEDPIPEVQLAYQRWLHTQGVEWKSAAGAFLADHPEPDGWLICVRGLFSTRGPGKTVFRALSAFGDGEPAGSFTEKVNDSKGCGGAMRAAPFGMWSSDPAEVFELAARSAALTHSHPSGYLSAGAFAVIVQQALLGRGLDDGVWLALQVLETWDGHEETSKVLAVAVELAEQGVPTPERIADTLGGGWVGEEALAIAVCATLAAGDDVELALRIAVHHAGDSDSTGAICGNIIGALVGIAGLPVGWLAELELRDVIEQVALDCLAEFGPSAAEVDTSAASGATGPWPVAEPAEPVVDEDWNERYPVRPLWSMQAEGRPNDSPTRLLPAVTVMDDLPESAEPEPRAGLESQPEPQPQPESRVRPEPQIERESHSQPESAVESEQQVEVQAERESWALPEREQRAAPPVEEIGSDVEVPDAESSTVDESSNPSDVDVPAEVEPLRWAPPDEPETKRVRRSAAAEFFAADSHPPKPAPRRINGVMPRQPDN